MKTAVIIPAGGSGTRIGGTLPKQYRKVAGVEILAYTLGIFNKCSQVNEIVVAVSEEYKNIPAKLAQKYGFSKPIKVVSGGKERQHSVHNALRSLSMKNGDLIIVHDSVRPLLPPEILKKALKTAKEKGTAVVATGVRDTIIKATNSFLEYPERKHLLSIQTPQIFRYEIINEAFRFLGDSGFIATDESMLVYNSGYEINFVEGSPLNFKITTSEDITLMKEIILGRRGRNDR
ncbi:MAG: 2-C-methyl-D-erythritol 4-phosphate cytidylyltransferase [Ignavibacteriales bacterium]|jgi:2-C-methyl-D-erythritol 4-phosphate cytidylyltransferase|nr:2-C-methyl-D-erythritol 4-phosphate cytidylyltransferase [Ignavibacteriaceae bacterium]NLH61228.1 2-C-methyl-D-erythritol 4-phosphate cytidylyltransferase [Ignavibacteriales bacterium]HOJ19114.1 2-C-methyl-D-erythritol 4-phosphate cytidylyltransferase [Ignavibacteriaceae bacterium]HPO54633.1 2-C-methyl-D-erythritol 4-phosphate cytidylyltransferase [Ignavibacteriaceae bacterium]